MKKTLLILLTLTITLFLVSCKEDEIPNEHIELDSMNTKFNVYIYDKDKMLKNNELEELFSDIQARLDYIHNLTDNFNAVKDLNNVFYINENIDTEIKIEEELYLIIDSALEYEEEFRGYFNISVGHIIDRWKDIIENEPGFYSDEEFAILLEEIKSIPVIENGITLRKNNGEHYITIKDGVKIDLGAIAKGYAVDQIKEMILAKGIKYFKIEGSYSSLEFGENPNRDNAIFRVGIRDPKNQIDYHEIVEVKNQAIATSGDSVQYYIHDNYKYHHIVSPMSNVPENYRSLVTIIGTDSMKLDALTTALISMPDEVYNEFVKNYPDYTFYSFK